MLLLLFLCTSSYLHHSKLAAKGEVCNFCIAISKIMSSKPRLKLTPLVVPMLLVMVIKQTLQLQINILKVIKILHHPKTADFTLKCDFVNEMVESPEMHEYHLQSECSLLLNKHIMCLPTAFLNTSA